MHMGCGYSQAACSSKTCDHVYLFNTDYENAKDIDQKLMEGSFPYDDKGRLLMLECGLLEREPMQILCLAAGLWYTETRGLITALHTLLQAVVLDQGLEGDLVNDIQKYLEGFIKPCLRERLIN